MELLTLKSDPVASVEARGHSSCTVPSLENHILAKAATSLSSITSFCPALQPSQLSSTQLKQDPIFSPTVASSLCSPQYLSPVLQSTLTSSGGLSAARLSAGGLSAREPSAGVHSPGGLTAGGCSAGGFSASGRSAGGLFAGGLSSGGLSMTGPSSGGLFDGPDKKHLNEECRKSKREHPGLSTPDDVHQGLKGLTKSQDSEDLVEMELDPLPEMPVLMFRESEEEKKWTVELSEEFRMLEDDLNEEADVLKDKKYKLLNMVLCSLVNENCSPGQKGWDQKKSVWKKIKILAEDITCSDPEFLLKVAVYIRLDLNKCLMSSFLLAFAASLPASKPHLRRYFCAAVQLPSDWLRVSRIYSELFSSSLPTCLKKALVDKFKQFSGSQLAQYCTRKWKKCKAKLQKDQRKFSLQKLIKRLHIKEPAELVMSILGKKYPADVKAFERSGLGGIWQSERAGQKMKLKQPDTWHTTLSREGHKAATWEKLIDNKSLPFVVMLKNLRNMITQGISAKHHNKILKRLRSESAVIQSKLLPFHFLTAYKVVMQQRKFVDSAAKRVSTKVILQGILVRLRRSKCFRDVDWMSAGRRRLRATMQMPFVYRLYKVKRRLLASQKKFDQNMLQRYLQALLKAMEISCKHNIPLLPGYTLVCVDSCLSKEKWKRPEQLFLPLSLLKQTKKKCKKGSETTEETFPAVSTEEVALFYALMLRYGCEQSQVMIMDYDRLQPVELESDNLFDNFRKIRKQTKECNDDDYEWTKHDSLFSKLIEDKKKVDNIIILSDSWTVTCLATELDKYHKSTNNRTHVINMHLTEECTQNDQHPQFLHLYDFNNDFLKCISEMVSTRLLHHVEHMDKLHGVPPPAGVKDTLQKTADTVSLPVSPKLRWREIRVFISSSLRDMYAERDVLMRCVFPELRRRAAQHCFYLQEVELRCGLTEEESAQSVELCLSEAARSHLLLGILGQRYGLVLPQSSLNKVPHNSWLDAAPSELSITEMEIRHFQSVFPDSAQNRMFFYFRSPDLLKSVPVGWRADFTAETRETAAKMEELKEWIQRNEFRVTENYPCEWAGVLDGRACVTGLEEFTKAVMDDLWPALQKLFVEELHEADLSSELNKQEVHQEAHRRHFHGRRKLISMALEKVTECQQKGGILLVEGRPGEGKTAFMAALAHALITPEQSNRAPVHDVVSYSTAASQSAGSITHLLRCLDQSLQKMTENEEKLTSTVSYRTLLSEFHLHLSGRKEDRPLALLVDGTDHVHDARAQVVSEWIPKHIPKGVCLVLSVTRDSVLRNTLSKKNCCVLFPLGELTWADRMEIVQKELSDAVSSQQIQTLLKKKGAVSPLYLRLACEELRNHTSLQQMDLQALPQSVSELGKHTLLRLTSQFGAAGLDWTMAALTISSTGLRERDLYSLLNLCNDLSFTQRSPSWQEALHLAKNPKRRVPMAVFYQLTLHLRRLIQPSVSQDPDELLSLTNEDVRSAFKHLYVSTQEDRTRAHLILAAHLWVRSDPHGNGTFLHCDEDALGHLLSHLMKCGQWEPVSFLLSSYDFLYANVRHGLLRPLLENFTLFSKRDKADSPSTEPSDELQQCRDFLQRHAPLLSDWPALFVQEALNEPDVSPAGVWAQRILQQGGVRALKRLNSEHTSKHTGELVSSLCWTPSCMTVSPRGTSVLVGTEEGTLHVFLSETKQELRSLQSSCDGISGCMFLDEHLICITLYSGQVEVWDIHSGCRIARLDAHSSRITGCDVSSDRKHFATVSLDFTLKVWQSRELKQVKYLLQPSPPNCVSFDCEGELVAVGCWDGAVQVWNWNKLENRTTLSGHHSSVQCVLFSPSSSSQLWSGSLDGEVRLWSVPAESCIWNRQAHCGSADVLHFLSDGETLLTAGQDGRVQVWSAGSGHLISAQEEQVQHRGFFYCHSSVRALASGHNGHFFSVSDDLCLRTWNINTERPPTEKTLSAACFLEKGKLLACGFSSGTLELWHQNSLINSNKVNDSSIGAVTGMPDRCLAVGCNDFTVTVWKLELDSEHCSADLSKVTMYTLEKPVAHLFYSNVLLGLSETSSITVLSSSKEKEVRCIYSWSPATRPLAVAKNDEKSLWILEETDCQLQFVFLISFFTNSWYSKYCEFKLCEDGDDENNCSNDEEEQCEESREEPCKEQSEELCEDSSEKEPKGSCEEPCEEQSKEEHEEVQEETCEEPSVKPIKKKKQRKVAITSAAMHKGFIVCGDARGYTWTNQPPSMAKWSKKMKAHSDRVSVLRLTEKVIISASYDGTVKLWDRTTKKQVGLFLCGAPVEILEVNEDEPLQMVCGDILGEVYFLSWTG